MKTSFQNSLYQHLANHIVMQAVQDYRQALHGHIIEYKKPDETIYELEQFFRSEWFKLLTKLDGELLIKNLQEEHKNERNTNTSYAKRYRGYCVDCERLL